MSSFQSTLYEASGSPMQLKRRAASPERSAAGSAAGSLSDAVVAAKKKAWPGGTKLHFHDLRGTGATRFYNAGFFEREIAEIMAWEEASVARIIRRYVGRKAAIKERIRNLDEARK